MQAANFRLLCTVLALAVLAGCGQVTTRPTDHGSEAEIRRAAQLRAAGEHLAAADLYRQLAARTGAPDQRARYLLDAAEASRDGGDWDGTRLALEQLDALVLGVTEDLRRRLLHAEVLLQERRASEALVVLDAPPSPELPTDLQTRYYVDLAETYRQLGNLLETAKTLQAVDALQTDPDARLQTQTAILRSLALLNERVLVQLQPSPPGVPGGWMQLALLVKQYGSDPAALAPELAAWRERFPQHPALPGLLSNYQERLQNQLQQVSRIAVLLPQSGVYADVAAAIRDGIMISRFELPPDRRPTLHFYDSTDPAGIWPLYSRAVNEGAELVIGPLQKDAVAQLLRAGELPVPVLALNQVVADIAPPQNMYFYSLSPEDEARQAAERAWLDGSRRPVILAPQGAWGDRLVTAFEERWRRLGGSVAGAGRYDPTGHDYTATITALLNLDQSEQRHQEMVRWLGRKLEFEPRRRADIDAVFLAARPVQAQGMRPQLQFHRAGDLPIYTTSHAWQGKLTASQVEDMRGIRLADIPWMVVDDPGAADSRELVASYLPKSASGYARLYAMGMDALRLVPHLKRLQSTRYESLDGSTGNLYMDESNQIHRQLVWLVLDEEPQILGFTPRLDLQGGEQAAPVVQEQATPVPAT
jgi:outer membrane PBP1 activator LpoA protein